MSFEGTGWSPVILQGIRKREGIDICIYSGRISALEYKKM